MIRCFVLRNLGIKLHSLAQQFDEQIFFVKFKKNSLFFPGFTLFFKKNLDIKKQ